MRVFAIRISAEDPMREWDRMQEILRTNDIVLISFVEALLGDASIKHVVLDQNMSILEGSIGALPRRLLVDEDKAAHARVLLNDAGLGHELVPPPTPDP